MHYQTAWEWAVAGKMPVPVYQAPSGSWLVRERGTGEGGRVVVYCRVSSPGQKDDLGRQVGRVVRGATGLGRAVSGVVAEVGSGLDGKRRKLHRVLSDPGVTVLVVEHRGRLARFGAGHLEAALAASGRRIVVLDPGETTSDLVRDPAEVLTSMCARLYGARAAKIRAARAVAAATGPEA